MGVYFDIVSVYKTINRILVSDVEDQTKLQPQSILRISKPRPPPKPEALIPVVRNRDTKRPFDEWLIDEVSYP
ncbi:hypothetical protein LXL04_019892 [Taraxacum kok-saghyz]